MIQRPIMLFAMTACLPSIVLAASYAPGAGDDFSFSNASDINGTFGQPIAGGSDIFFPFANFSASADGANPSVSLTDTFTMDVQVDPGWRFDAVAFNFSGTRTITGTSGGNTVQADGSLTVNGLAGEPFAGSDSYSFFDDQPAAGSSWNDSASLIIPLGTNVTELNLVFTQDLMAIATDGSAQITATIDIPGVVFLSVIPEPSSLALLGVGGLALLRRRERKNRSRVRL